MKRSSIQGGLGALVALLLQVGCESTKTGSGTLQLAPSSDQERLALDQELRTEDFRARVFLSRDSYLPIAATLPGTSGDLQIAFSDHRFPLQFAVPFSTTITYPTGGTSSFELHGVETAGETLDFQRPEFLKI